MRGVITTMRVAIVVGLAVTLMGCPFDEEDGDPNNYVVATDIAKAYKQAYCTYAARCGLFPDATTCNAAALNPSIVTIGLDVNELDAVYEGRAVYNGSNVKKCFDAMAAQTCDRSDRDGRVLGTLLECRDIMRGTRDAGEACTIDAECVSQSCSGGSTGTTCAMGVCIGDAPPSYALGQLGQPCSPYCDEGLHCDFTNDTCQPLKTGGFPCQGNDECTYGLLCITESATTQRRCNVAPTVGQPCPDFTCRDDGQYCSSTTMTCKQVGLPPTMCSSSAECSQYYACDFAVQQCKKGPTLGMSCSTGARCFDAGTYCDPLSLVCTAAQPDGSYCNTDEQCASGSCDTTLSLSVCVSPMACPAAKA